MKTCIFQMSSSFLVLMFLILIGSVLQDVQALAEDDLLPEGRVFVPLRDGERNPFSQQLEVKQPASLPDVENEESRLRRILSGIKIGGISRSEGGSRVLLGSLILKSGDTLPPLIDDQQETLRVASIEPSEVRLAFVEKDSETQSRLIILPLKMSPQVGQFLYGEAVEKLVKIGSNGHTAMEDLSSKSVQDFLKGSEDVQLQNITDRKVEMMGVIKNATESNNKKE